MVVAGAVPAWEIERAEQVIEQILDRHRAGGVARVRMTRLRSPFGPILVQIDHDLDGRVRTQVAAPSGAAVTAAATRLDRHLQRLDGFTALRWWSEPGRPPLACPSETRPILRRKDIRPRHCDPRAAVAAMDRMDYDAHLFIDSESGQDAVVYWAGPRGVALARRRGTYPARAHGDAPLHIDPRKIRTLTDTDAAVLLCERGLPFLFFSDPVHRRGRLLYRRYDGDLGLLVPNSAPPAQ
ncbi:hypothetical protein D7D52_34330 [Nocardia yunnanensis]|uniref:Sigma 54 modulation/S30EA ribosomal protein C-terminal domain-containing protein n=2 Tax=Nocardia yunnanensis TaxID=2382165 RepID=A0A386ZKF2_9NOCA|nr:hypothetical protein D7D52_34330 [Nocardia yunnanensis]